MSQDEEIAARLRGLPSVQHLLEHPQAASLLQSQARPALVAALRAVLDDARVRLRYGTSTVPQDAESLLGAAARRLEAAPGLRRVINATGILLHTNLGRAPLPEAAIAAIAATAAGYSNLEFDLEAGVRGSRMAGIDALLRLVTGAEAGLAVNNNAAAMLLVLGALAGDGEVIVSRGELVEIGGGFRIPDIIRQGGARLVEIGTTNRTRLADYRDAITPATRVLLKVHPSNFRMVGFTEAAGLRELAVLARERDLLLVEDLGSGALVDPARLGRPAEATVQQSLAAGVDLVAFSGDKLLGGPQAGLLVGRAAVVARLGRHPLLRALRLDKLSIAALEATLRLYLDDPVAHVPVLRALAQSATEIRLRAERLAALAGIAADIVSTSGYAGGGTLPGEALPSAALRLPCEPHGPDDLATRLRRGHPAVVGRIQGNALLLDMLAVPDDAVEALAAAIRPVLHGAA